MSIHEAHVDDAAALCSSLADSVSSSMGGTSGVLLELALRAMVARFTAVNGADVSWADAVAAGVDAIGALGGAQPGMRTMVI